MQESLAHNVVADAAIVRRVQRALFELRCGRAVRLHDRGGEAAVWVLPVEAADESGLSGLRQLGGGRPTLLLTARRASALGLSVEGGSVVALAIEDRAAAAVAQLADPVAAPAAHAGGWAMVDVGSSALAEAAIDLAKMARLLPAVVTVPAAQDATELLSVSAEEVERYRFAGPGTLERVAESAVPLAGAESTRMIAFRPTDGGHAHLAIVIGDPDPGAATLIRLHSQCFTGDLLGSLRCDCGDQLRGAIETIAAEGAGILLYLAQEGRDIGLVNKLRAYALQDRGADTLDANEALGFDADERVYLPAAEMLRQLGHDRVRLLTNNPEKVGALRRCGIAVEERVPHRFPANGHNELYLTTKAQRFGHLL